MDNPIPPEDCVCASFWTIRQAHKKDCPLYVDNPREEALGELRSSSLWGRLIGILDNNFPKGECQERGAAMVMLAEFLEPISEYTQQKINDANSGHWYAGTYGKDTNGFEIGHRCHCGLKARDESTIQSHAAWKLAELQLSRKEPTLNSNGLGIRVKNVETVVVANHEGLEGRKETK